MGTRLPTIYGIISPGFPSPFRHTPYGIPNTTVGGFYFQYRTDFQLRHGFSTSPNTVEFLTAHLTGSFLQLGFHISAKHQTVSLTQPCGTIIGNTVRGLSVMTWVLHIADYRTELPFAPYGIISLGTFPMTLLLCTVRVSNLYRTLCFFFSTFP